MWSDCEFGFGVCLYEGFVVGKLIRISEKSAFRMFCAALECLELGKLKMGLNVYIMVM